MRIKSIPLSDQSALEFADFNVFIGGNSVGKTTLMLELYSRAVGANRHKWHWTDSDGIVYHSDDPAKDMDLLCKSMAVQYEGANRFYISQAIKNLLGQADLDSTFRFSPDEFRELKSGRPEETVESRGERLRAQKYRRAFISFASCEARLNLPSRINVNGLNQAPQDALNVLYRNRALRTEVDATLFGQFGMHLTLLDHPRVALELGLSKTDAPEFNTSATDLQEEFARIETWKDEHFLPIEDVGHGIRSMAKLLMTLLEPVNQVIIIDEPEMHIYPAQKRWLGRTLVGLAAKQAKQVFVVTHDPIVLQGILDTQAKTRIFRLDVDGAGKRIVQRCDLEHVTDIGAKRNQDSYLQGLFYQRCIGVEGAADRAFYQIMMEELLGTRIVDKDLGFVACGGKSSSKNVAHIARQVGLRCAFIYDFDVLMFDVPMLREMLTMRGGDPNVINELAQLWQSEFKSDARAIKAGAGGAEKLGIASPFIQTHRSVFERIISALAGVGIFVVPGGSLESWATDVEPRARFADLAPDVIKAAEPLKLKIADFLGKVLEYVGC